MRERATRRRESGQLSPFTGLSSRWSSGDRLGMPCPLLRWMASQ